MSLTDRLASLALVVADLNLRLSQSEQLAAQEKQRADAAEAKLAGNSDDSLGVTE